MELRRHSRPLRRRQESVLASWQVYPAMAVDPDFTTKVKAQLGGAQGPLYFLCRSGRGRAPRPSP